MKIDWEKFYGTKYGETMTEAEREKFLKEFEEEDTLVEELSFVDWM